MSQQQPPTHPVICILGPTAAGKTDLTLALADTLPCTLISVDSAQIYRGMDIGTAKPTPELLTKYPHKLIDIIEPEASYSAAQFAHDARLLIDDAHQQQRIAVLSGGTMLYYHALFGGLADLPPSNPQRRALIEQRISEHGLAPLYEQLVSLDAYAAEKLTPNDHQRIVRFTELYETTGLTPSELFAQQQRQKPKWQTLCIGLEPDRASLHQRIAQRFHSMIKIGLIDEVAQLRQRAHLSATHPSMRAVGYRQIWQYLDGAYQREEAIERGIIATRQLAKRQITWMRNRLREHLDPQIYDPLDGKQYQAAHRHIQQWLHSA